jgi:hypothetical protein
MFTEASIYRVLGQIFVIFGSWYFVYTMYQLGQICGKPSEEESPSPLWKEFWIVIMCLMGGGVMFELTGTTIRMEGMEVAVVFVVTFAVPFIAGFVEGRRT